MKKEGGRAAAYRRGRRAALLAGMLGVAALAAVGGRWVVKGGSSESAANLDAYPRWEAQAPSGARIVLVVAREERERRLGLSYQHDLPQGEGLLLWWGVPGTRSIWMKGMRFAIDALWLDCGGRVVGIRESLRPESFPEAFRVENPACGVLELRAGEVARLGLAEGDQLQLSPGPEPLLR